MHPHLHTALPRFAGSTGRHPEKRDAERRAGHGATRAAARPPRCPRQGRAGGQRGSAFITQRTEIVPYKGVLVSQCPSTGHGSPDTPNIYSHKQEEPEKTPEITALLIPTCAALLRKKYSESAIPQHNKVSDNTWIFKIQKLSHWGTRQVSYQITELCRPMAKLTATFKTASSYS